MRYFKRADNSYYLSEEVICAADTEITQQEFDSRPASVPQSVTMRQARLALLQQGLLSQVEAAVTNAEQEVQIEWEYSSAVERNKALVQTLTASLGWTTQQVDDLFRLAGAL